MNRKKAPQAANRTKAPWLPQVLHRVQETMTNPAIPGKHIVIITGKKDITTTSAQSRLRKNAGDKYCYSQSHQCTTIHDLVEGENRGMGGIGSGPEGSHGMGATS